MGRSLGSSRVARVVLGALLLCASVLGIGLDLVSRPAAAEQTPVARAATGGRELYQQQCASCHGAEGGGTYRGPSLEGAGAASADFYLRSGRMPLPSSRVPSVRRPPAFNNQQIEELVEYVASFGDGPSIPTLSQATAVVAEGNEIYRLNCVQCHNWDGKGGALVGSGGNAPTLHGVPAEQVAEAVRIGPGPMPVFSRSDLTDEELNNLVAYVVTLNDPLDRGGWGLAHWGPSTEMLAGFGTLGLLLVVTGLLGKREQQERR